MFKKRITSLFMAICLLAGTALSTVSVHAAPSPQPTEGTTTGGSEASAGVLLSKVLTMDPNVVTPDKTFTFTIEKYSLNNSTETADTATMPAIGPTFTLKTTTTTSTQSATISTKYSVDNVSGNYHETKAADDKYKAVTMTSTDLLADVTFSHAGVYVYSVTETAPLQADDPTIDNSLAKYYMVVYVANKYTAAEKTTYADGVYVSAVGVWKKLDTDENTVTDKNEAVPVGTGFDRTGLGEKVDATTGSGTTSVGSQFEFVNVYSPLAPLMIEKTVSGDYADRTLKFSFTTTLTLPATATQATSYTALICKNGAQVTEAPTTVEFTQAKNYAATYSLSDGEYLLFVDDMTKKNGILPVGTTYTVSETAIENYTPSVKVYYGNGTTARVEDTAATITAAGVVGSTNTTTNSKLVVGDVSLITATADKIVANQTVVSNAYKTVTPTGIIMDNLPGILLVVIAVGGMCLYLYFKNKKHKEA